MISLVRKYELEVAHRLTAGVPEGHKCRRLHGHRYVLTIELGGRPDADGMLIEYADLDVCVKPILRLIDHNDLNTLSERCSTQEAADISANPTVERLALWFAVRLRGLSSCRQEQGMKLLGLHIEEDSQSSIQWRPDPKRGEP